MPPSAQCLAAAERGKHVRQARARVKRYVHDEPQHLARILDSYRHPDYPGDAFMSGYAEALGDVLEIPLWASFLDTMQIGILVDALPRVGPRRTRVILTAAGLAATTTMAASTRRQRLALATVVREKFPANQTQETTA